MNKSTRYHMIGGKNTSPKFTCPNCGGIEFCLGSDEIWNDPEEGHNVYADCTRCLTSILVAHMKERYHKDKSKDFDIDGAEHATIDLECPECRNTHELGWFTIIYYYGTLYHDIKPKPDYSWKCPEHPSAVPHTMIGRKKKVIA